MAKHKIVITDRDEKILGVLKKFGYIREDYLARYLGMDYSLKSVKDVLQVLSGRLKKHEIIIREKIKVGKPFYWWLAKTGVEIIEAIPIKKISLITLDHNDIVASLAINLLIENPDLNLQTEFELKQNLYGADAREKKIPDLIINENEAIEIEISKKNNKRWVNAVSQYLSMGYESITYYTNSKSIATSISKICSNNPKFRFKIFSKDVNINTNFTSNESKEQAIKSNIEDQFLGASDRLKSILNR
jgi:hypothetical protein